MRIEQLHYFLEAAKTNSITKAAEKLFISPQSLSESLTKLEKEFNAEFFSRSPQGIQLTSEGNYFMSHAVNMLSEYQETQHYFTQLKLAQSKGAPLKICFNTYIAIAMLPQILQSYYQISTPSKLMTYEIPTINVLEDVIDHQADISLGCISPLYLERSRHQQWLKTVLNCHILFHDRLQLLTHHQCPLAKKKSVTLDEALEYPMFSDTYASTNHYFQVNHHTSNATFLPVSIPDVLRQLVENQIAISLTTQYMLKHYLSKDLVAIDIEPEANLIICAFWLKKNPRIAEIKRFLGILTDLYSPNNPIP